MNVSDRLVTVKLGPVAEIHLDHPPLNLITVAVCEQLSDALDAIERAPQVRAVVLTAAGERAFCAGSDIKETAQLRGTIAEGKLLLEKFVFRRLSMLPVPTIAAIQGHALGGGMELALCCDLRIAASGSRVGFPEVTLGAVPGSGGTQRLPRIVGPAHAKMLLFTGEAIGVDEAARIGLINEVVMTACARDRAFKIAESVASAGPQAVRAAKLLVDVAMETQLDHGLALELDASQRLSGTDDAAEGARAFFEKRAPVFSLEADV